MCFIWKFWQCLPLSSSQSKRLTIARCKIKWLFSDKILCSSSIRENLAISGVPQESEKKQANTLNYLWKKHLKTTWTGYKYLFTENRIIQELWCKNVFKTLWRLSIFAFSLLQNICVSTANVITLYFRCGCQNSITNVLCIRSLFLLCLASCL